MKSDRPETNLDDAAKFGMLQYKVAEHELASIWRTFRQAGLHPILIKGWAAAQYYPEPWTRSLGDFDLAFPAAEYRDAEAVCAGNLPNRTDLHRELRHLDTERWERLLERSVELECAGEIIRVLCPEDHLRVLCVHWLNDGGAYRDRLRDIGNLLTKHRGSFDWELCLAPLTAVRRRWIEVAVALADRYLEDTDLSFVPFAAKFGTVPGWVIKALEREWGSGRRLVPLHFVLREPKELLIQIGKRLPPNPIQSTIELEADLDERPRAMIQTANLFKRISPSYKRVWPALKRLLGPGPRNL